MGWPENTLEEDVDAMIAGMKDYPKKFLCWLESWGIEIATVEADRSYFVHCYRTYKETEDQWKYIPASTCECGAEHDSYGTHSDWCPLFDEDMGIDHVAIIGED